MPSIEWSIMKKTTGYSTVSKSCSLCLSEKLYISEFMDKENLLNPLEIVTPCRHQSKFLLKNYKKSEELFVHMFLSISIYL